MRTLGALLCIMGMALAGCTSRTTVGDSAITTAPEPPGGAVAVDSTQKPTVATAASVTTVETTPSAPTTLPAPVDPSAIEGTWQLVDRPVYLTFAEDRTWLAGYTRSATVGFDFGTYEFDGRVLVIRPSEEATASCKRVGRMEIAVSANHDRIEVVSIDDPCAQRRTDLRGGFERVES